MRGVNVGAIWREGIELERKRKMEEDKKILGITEEELEQVKEDFDAEDIEDFDLVEEEVEYEIWVVGTDKDDYATYFEVMLDDGYTDLEEARKCYDFCSIPENLKEKFENGGITIPEDVAHLYLRLEAVLPEGPNMMMCNELIEECEVKIL